MAQQYDLGWLRDVVASSVIRNDSTVELRATGGGAFPGQELPRDPEKIAYLVRLLTAVRASRALAKTYNLVLLAALVLLTIWHLVAKARLSRRAARIRRQGLDSPSQQGRTLKCDDTRDEGTCTSPSYNSSSSSSSSTIQGTETPPDLRADVEREPLLKPSSHPSPTSPSQSRKRRRTWPRNLSSRITSSLMYQPPPLPIINRTLPSNATSLLVISYLALNAFYHLYGLPLEPKYLFVTADRAALIFITNLPLLYLLSAKNAPLRHLTGYSHESLNVLHRGVGELLCFEALVHFSSLVVFQAITSPEWLLRRDMTLSQFLSLHITLLGIGAFVSYEALFFMSLGSFRHSRYEFFLASHVVLQAAALAFLWLHHHGSRPYVGFAAVVFVLDRVVWRLCGARRVAVDARLTVMPDGDTVLVSADWDVPRSRPPSRSGLWSTLLARFRPRSVWHGWKPTGHVFLTVPVLGWTRALQTHPFTIASAAPDLSRPDNDRDEGAGSAAHAWFGLIVRARAGFTEELLHYALRHRSARVLLDGPYGSSRALDVLKASEHVVLVAGGSGIAVAFPLAWELVVAEARRRRSARDGTAAASTFDPGADVDVPSLPKVRLLWIVHSEEHKQWIPSHVMDEVVSAGLDLVVPEPTALAGRPDAEANVRDWIVDADLGGRQTGVLVSGPDGLNRAVRNTCAKCVGDGADVKVVVEKFGW